MELLHPSSPITGRFHRDDRFSTSRRSSGGPDPGARPRDDGSDHSAVLSALTDASVYLKLENLQRTGSFKVRGAFNRILSLTERERERGIVAASSGNHGAAVAPRDARIRRRWAHLRTGRSFLERRSTIYAELGGDVRTAGTESGATERFRPRVCCRSGHDLHLMPYNDEAVIAGQGTIGAEIASSVAVGRSGRRRRWWSAADGLRSPALPAISKRSSLASKRSAFLRRQKTRWRWPRRFAPGVSSRRNIFRTLSDGTAGGIEQGIDHVWTCCRSLVDAFVNVSEDEIRAALRLFIESHAMLCEGAAALAIAGLLASKEWLRERTVVVVICGANITADKPESGVMTASPSAAAPSAWTAAPASSVRTSPSTPPSGK